MTGKNRKTRRAREGNAVPFDPTQTFKLTFDARLPGGLLRSEHPARYAGALIAVNEIDLLRQIFVKMLEVYGFINYDKAVVGALASVINPLPLRIRGMLAYALIQGQGLDIERGEIEVCAGCRAEKQISLAPPEEQPEVPEGSDEDPDPVMVDNTQHGDQCSLRVENGGMLPEEGETPLWEMQPVINVLLPQMYESLQNAAGIIPGITAEPEVTAEEETEYATYAEQDESPIPEDVNETELNYLGDDDDASIIVA